ncbi:MAG: response regulator [Anaerolineae bacterium]|nr:response regulator [Anaerolineae bacterium]
MTDVLVISNNLSSCIAYTAALSGYGYEVTEAHNVDEGLTFLKGGHTPRVIVIDVKFSATLQRAYQEFRQLYSPKDTPYLIVIGGSENAHLANGMADEYLTRPVELNDLLHCVQNSIAV